jgi:hypothetical protein
LATLYLTILVALPADLFWSPDEGAKYLEVRSYVWRDGLQRRVVYGARYVDPGFRFYPHRADDDESGDLVINLFPEPGSEGRLTSNWSPLFPLVSLAPYTLLRLHGLYLVPIVCGLLTALLAGAAARRIVPEAEVPTILAVGLCSPVLFYSLRFWEHTLAVCLATAALAVWLDDSPRRCGRVVVSWGCLAVAIVLRFELAVVAGSLGIALAADRIRSRLETSGRFSPAALPWAVATTVVGLVFAAGGALWFAVRHARLLRLVGVKEDWLVRVVLGKVIQLGPWHDLPLRLRHALIDVPGETGPHLAPEAAWLGLLGVMVAVASVAFRHPRRGWLFVAGATLVTAVAAAAVISPDRIRGVHALVLPTPWVVLAMLLPRPAVKMDGPCNAVFSITSWLVIISAVTLSLKPVLGGLEWGSRYHLVAYVLAAVLACTAFVHFLRSVDNARLRAAVTVVGVASLAVGCMYQVRGIGEVTLTKIHLAAYRDQLVVTRVPVITDLAWLPGSLARTFAEFPILMVGGPENLSSVIGSVGSHAGRFRLITSIEDEQDVRAWIDGARPYTVDLVRDRTVAGLRLLDVAVRSAPATEQGTNTGQGVLGPGPANSARDAVPSRRTD